MSQTVYWSDLADGGSYNFTGLGLYDPSVNTGGYILNFDSPVYITPYDLFLEANDDLTAVTITDLYTYKTVTLYLDALTVTTSNVTFAGGGVLLVGDGLYGAVYDNLGNTLTGGSGDDQLVGLGGDDTLVGGLGWDVFIDAYGDNRLLGGYGNDWFDVYSEIGSSNIVSGGPGRDFYYLDDESASLLGPPPGTPGNNYVVTDFAAGLAGDVIYTSDLVYITIGYTDQDPFAAGFLRLRQDGPNTIYEGDRDGAIGGTYTWTNLITLQNVSVTLNPYNFPDLIIGTDADNLLTGTAGNDLMPALLGNDTLSGLGGKDYLAGAEGNDILNGGTGADSMLGGDGDDVYHVDDVDDAVLETSNTAGGLLLPGAGAGDFGPGLLDIPGITDTVIAAINYSLASLQFVENVTLSGAASRATGNALANALTGNAGADTLTGAGGNDTLNGGTGGDSMAGGAGNDTYVVDALADTVTELYAQGTDTVRSSVSETLANHVERLVLTGAGHINGTGNGAANLLTGNAGNNVLNGGAGADTVKGMGGNDTLVWDAADALRDGGTGIADVLKVNGASVTLDLRLVDNTKILNTEVINITGTGANHLKLNLQDVLDISASNNALRVDGNAGDVLHWGGTPWTPQGPDQIIGLNNYHRYTQGAGILLVDSDITSMND